MSIKGTPLKLGIRELRLDFLRGLALLVVLIDHIEDQTVLKVVRPWMPVSTCYFDGAEAFVFLSGLVFGRAFQRRLQQQGLVACQEKAIRRAMTIYLTYLLTAWIAIGIGVCCRDYSSLLVDRLSLTEGAMRCALWSLPMCYQPWGFPILALYTVILPFMPLFLFWQSRSPSTAWIIPFGLYLAAQLIPELQLPKFPWGSEWTFNPLAWQFLFFIGLGFGTTRFPRKTEENTDKKDVARIATFRQVESPAEPARRNSHLPKTPEQKETAPDVDGRQSPHLNTVLLLGSLTVLVLGLLIRNDLIGWIPASKEGQKRLFHFVNQWTCKHRIGPVRITHFMSLVILFSMILPVADAKVWRSRLLSPVVQCGQNSLAVYSFGLILTFLSILAFRFLGESPGTILMIEFDCCALSVGLTYLMTWYRSAPQMVLEKATAKTQTSASPYK